MQRITFLVKGSAQDPYKVTFASDGVNLSASCTCPAGAKKGTHCKHRIGVLQGESKGIVSDNVADGQTVLSWLPGTALEAALAELSDAEQRAQEAQAALKRVKADVARIMMHGE